MIPPGWLLSLRETQVSPEYESYFCGVLSVSKFEHLVKSVIYLVRSVSYLVRSVSYLVKSVSYLVRSVIYL